MDLSISRYWFWVQPAWKPLFIEMVPVTEKKRKRILWDSLEYLKELETHEILLLLVGFELVTFCVRGGQLDQTSTKECKQFNCIFDHCKDFNSSAFAHTTVFNVGVVNIHGVYEKGCRTSPYQSLWFDILPHFYYVVKNSYVNQSRKAGVPRIIAYAVKFFCTPRSTFGLADRLTRRGGHWFKPH